MLLSIDCNRLLDIGILYLQTRCTIVNNRLEGSKLLLRPCIGIQEI